MTDTEIELIARAAGLKTALEQFRADVKAAAEEAERLRGAVTGTLTPQDEPWPPMRVPGRD
ncbi:MAG: hypothetical protein JO128_19255 [Alphaproteobacteria bacterium]|nr:hypothetical protein [Alphaproteobacteria bacterium]